MTIRKPDLPVTAPGRSGTAPVPAADAAGLPEPQIKRSSLMTIRKPNRMTTPKRAVLNGARTSHASMPRVRGRWRLDSGRVTARAGSHRPGGSLGEAGHAADDGLPDIAEHPGRPTVIAGLREVPDD